MFCGAEDQLEERVNFVVDQLVKRSFVNVMQLLINILFD